MFKLPDFSRKKPVYTYDDSDKGEKKGGTAPVSPPVHASGDGAEKPPKERKIKKPKPEKPIKEKPVRHSPRITKRGIFAVISIVLALVIALVISPLVTRMTNAKIGTALQAIADIPKGSVLEVKSFEAVEVPLKVIPKNAVEDFESIEGRYAAADFSAGDYVLYSKISDTLPFKDAFLYELPNEKQVMGVRIKNFENGLSGKLLAGDVVSVYASISSGEDKDGSYLALAPAELRYLLVLSATTETGDEFDKNNVDDGEELELPVTVELMVGERQARALAGLNHDAVIHLAFVSRGNPEYEKSVLDLQEQILEELELAEAAAREEQERLALEEQEVVDFE